MYKGRSVLAIIPARSGSKGLPHKNIKELNGKPLIAYSIEQARETDAFDEIHVSTDSEDYLEIAYKYGADKTFLRDDDLAGDVSSTWDVVEFVIRKYADQGKRFDYVVLLQPTSPLRKSEDILSTLDLIMEKNVGVATTICEMEHSPLWSSVLEEDKSLPNIVENTNSYIPRQKLEKYYRLTGAAYALNCDEFVINFKKGEDPMGRASFGVVTEQKNAVDIDTLADFEYAEFLMKKKN